MLGLLFAAAATGVVPGAVAVFAVATGAGPAGMTSAGRRLATL